MDQKAKKTKLKLKRETVRTLDDSALKLLDGVAGGTHPSAMYPEMCGSNSYEASICAC
ncbi:hypothetical protein [Archangium sp.]|jgi:hypothetical protein|uniref:hypothetical protein n=1 Tax=Archangium sp. TaxID=1872627 RepID=UPI002ED9E4FD